eukprot:356029-Chlamydomonas_euryale.AAC.1
MRRLPIGSMQRMGAPEPLTRTPLPEGLAGRGQPLAPPPFPLALRDAGCEGPRDPARELMRRLPMGSRQRTGVPPPLTRTPEPLVRTHVLKLPLAPRRRTPPSPPPLLRLRMLPLGLLPSARLAMSCRAAAAVAAHRSLRVDADDGGRCGGVGVSGAPAAPPPDWSMASTAAAAAAAAPVCVVERLRIDVSSASRRADRVASAQLRLGPSAGRATLPQQPARASPVWKLERRQRRRLHAHRRRPRRIVTGGSALGGGAAAVDVVLGVADALPKPNRALHRLVLLQHAAQRRRRGARSQPAAGRRGRGWGQTAAAAAVVTEQAVQVARGVEQAAGAGAAGAGAVEKLPRLSRGCRTDAAAAWRPHAQEPVSGASIHALVACSGFSGFRGQHPCPGGL